MDIKTFLFSTALETLCNHVPIVNKIVNSALKSANKTNVLYQQEFQKGYEYAKNLNPDELAEKIKNRKSDSPMMLGMAQEYNERMKKTEKEKIMNKLVNSSNKICAMCRYWNGGRGCPSLRVKPGGFFELDNKDEQQCFKTGFKRAPLSGGCSDFIKNY